MKKTIILFVAFLAAMMPFVGKAQSSLTVASGGTNTGENLVVKKLLVK